MCLFFVEFYIYLCYTYFRGEKNEDGFKSIINNNFKFTTSWV